jgi:hypothetical protein
MSTHHHQKDTTSRIYPAGFSSPAWIGVCALIIASLTISARAWLAPAAKAAPTVSIAKVEIASVAVPQGNSAQKERFEAEIITIRPNGFEPSEITRPKGRFILAVDNRSGVEEVTLRLDRETGNREREVRVHRKKLDWREVFDLNPGRYTLTEANHPNWVCHITIGAH